MSRGTEEFEGVLVGRGRHEGVGEVTRRKVCVAYATLDADS